ncbi:alpha tubulin suppressor [Mucor velutinosus]|uniref:Alpha tubulin suppressor n=1 Tax=Mucor velutinosus TaxID=708070 RepID=A0AAN7DL25_9FUNG|nr:alpha tubulin suppressor [Mucor velutinosus]
MATSNRYEFQPPMNMNAIRSNIMQRIKQRNEHNKQPLTPPPSSSSVAASKHDIQYIHLDNGLPSPPIESCTFDDVDTFEMANNHSSTLPDSPPSPVMSLTKSCSSSTTGTTVGGTTLESSEAIREKIRILKEEKHRLFQTMKDLLSQPAQPVAAETVVAAASTVAASIIEKPAPKQQESVVSKPMAERSRSHSRDNSLKSRPISRSRSISHTEFSRPLSRYSGNYYHDRRSPPRFYGNDNRSYPYNRSSYPHTSSQQSQSQTASLPSSSSSPTLNMSRRVLNSNNINNNNNNNNSSYVPSRSQLAGRPSSSSAAAVSGGGIASASASTSTTFRPLNRSSSDRHSRY